VFAYPPLVDMQPKQEGRIDITVTDDLTFMSILAQITRLVEMLAAGIAGLTLTFQFTRSNERFECKAQKGVYSASLQTPWPESARELYRPRDRRLSEKLALNFCG
jgi:hypothetical protein